MKCQHPKTTTLYAQRRDGTKRAFKPEGRKCDSCGAVLPVGNQENPQPASSKHHKGNCPE